MKSRPSSVQIQLRPNQNWLELHPPAKIKHPSWLRFFLAYLPSLLWAGLIFWFSSQPVLPRLTEPLLEFLWKKAAHFLIYSGLYFWLWWGSLVSGQTIQTKFTMLRSLIILLFIAFYAVSDELHQSFVAGRNPALRDVLIDVAGAGTTAIILKQFQIWPNWLRQTLKWLVPS